MINLRSTVRLPLYCAFVNCLFALPLPAQAPSAPQQPTTRRAKVSHQELYKSVSGRPLNQAKYISAQGKPLSESERVEVDEAVKALDQARDARKKGDYPSAKQKADRAKSVFRRILGDTHYQSISASILSDTMNRITTAPPADAKRLAEADKFEATAEAAFKGGRMIEARNAAREALEIREQLLGKEHAEVVYPLQLLGSALTELHAQQDAETVLTRAVQSAERTYGKNHPQSALVLDRLGWLRINQRKDADADPLLRGAVYIFNTTVGETLDTAESLDNLGTALAAKGDFDEALRTKLRALFIRETLVGPDRQETAVSLSNLAWIYARVNYPEEVIPLRRRALAILEKTAGPEHRDTLTESSNLAQAYVSEGKFDEAIKVWEPQIARDDARTGPPDVGAIARLSMLGAAYFAAGRQADGERTLQRAYERAIQLYESGEVDAAMNELGQLAAAYSNRRMLDDTVKVREQLKKWEDARGGSWTLERVRGTMRLGQSLIQVGRYQEAKELLKKVATQAEALSGAEGKETAACYSALSEALENLGELDDAARAAEKVLQISEKLFSRQSLPVVYACHSIGRVQTLQKRYDLAKFSLEEALETLGKIKRDDAQEEITIRQDLALCLQARDQHDEAAKMAREALQLARDMHKKRPSQRTDAMVASCIKRLTEVLAKNPSAGADEKVALNSELQQILTRLKESKSLSAQEKKWLAEIGGASASAR